MLSILLVVAIIVFLAISVVWAVFIRKLRKTRIRFFGIVISFVLSLIGVLVTKAVFSGSDFVESTLIPLFRSNGSNEFAELLQASPALCDTITGCISALALPVLMLAIFLVLDFFSWIVYLLISLIRGAAMKEKDAEPTPYAMPRTIALSAVQAILILIVWMVPIATYAEMAPAVMDGILDAQIIEDPSTQETVDTIVKDYVKPVDENGAVRIFRVLGVSAISDTLTSFDVNGTPVRLRDELRVVTTLGCDIFQLAEKEPAEYGEAEATVLQNFADSFRSSGILPAVAGEVLHGATSAWKNGETFIGVGEDIVRFDESGMFDDFITSLINVLHDDTAAGRTDAFCTDVGTVADLGQILIRRQILSNTGDLDTLVEILTREGVINEMILTLGENASMKCLIPEITNIGVRAIGSALEIKEDDEALYHALMEELAAGLNAAKAEADRETYIEQLLHESFESAGILADEEVLHFYSEAMVTDLLVASGDDPIRAADVTAFFAVYAWSASTESNSAHAGNTAVGSSVPLATTVTDEETLRRLLSGTVYEGMTEAELRACCAALLADAQIPDETASVVTSLYSSASMDTVLVTLKELLTDPVVAAESIHAGSIGAEAAAIQAVFEAAKQLMDELEKSSEIELEAISDSFGTILDSLATSPCYGKEKTALLFIALMQSDAVRDAANLDMDTATQLGRKGSEGETVKYRDVFHTVAVTVSVLQSMDENSGRLENEDIVKMIESINPQSAGMIEIYITPDRMTDDYNMKAEHSEVAAPLLSNTFGYLADHDVEDYEKEAEAINQVMSLTMAARDHANDPSSNKSLFGDDGILNDQGSTNEERAAHTIETLMASEAIAHSVNTTTYEDDPFELSNLMQQDENQDDAQTLKDAIQDYYAVPENHTEENRETLIQIGNLFGLSDMANLLGE